MNTETYLKRLVDETTRIYATEQLQLSHLMDERKLTRPSFAFIRDIVKELMSKTRILRDVFGPADLDPKRRGSTAVANSDRHARVEFVQKLVDFVAKNKHPTQGCVASKIVAGSDPIKTNELLQKLARVALAKLNERQRTSTATRPSRQPQTQQQQQQQQVSSARGKRSAGSQRLTTKGSPSSRKSSVQDGEAKEDVMMATRSSDKAKEKCKSPSQEVTSNQEADEPTQEATKTENPEESVESLRINVKKLHPKLEQMVKIDQHLIEKLQISLRKLTKLIPND